MIRFDCAFDLMSKTKSKTLFQQLKAENEIHYRDGGQGTVRVWRADWFGDQFEVVSTAEFATFRALAKKLQFTFQEHTED